MGFDQYHEPADELDANTRTFARMIAATDSNTTHPTKRKMVLAFRLLVV